MRRNRPLWVLMVVGVAVVMVSVFTYAQRADRGSKTSNEKSAEDRSVNNPVKATPKSVEAGRKIFLDKCDACHGEDATGNGEMAAMLNKKPANLTDPQGVGKRTDKNVFNIITNGKDPMPKFGDLPEEDRWNLVNFIRSVQAKMAGNDSANKN